MMTASFVQHQAAVDLVGADHQVAPFTDPGNSFEFVSLEHAADGIVRIAQHEQTGAVVHRRLGRIPIPGPALVGPLPQGGLLQLAPVVGRGAEEGWVDRRCREHAVAVVADRAAGHVEGADHARQPDQPARFDAPAVIAIHRVDDRAVERWPGVGVAQHAMIEACPDRVDHDLGGGEIHVGHPHRNDVAAFEARPFFAGHRPSINDSVEIPR